MTVPTPTLDAIAAEIAALKANQKDDVSPIPPIDPIPPVVTYPPRRVLTAANSPIIDGKAYILTSGDDAVVKNLEASGAFITGDYNAAVVRVSSQRTMFRNVWFHDNQQGVLTDQNLDSFDILDSLFERNGDNRGSGIAHNIYAQAKNFSFTHSASYAAKMQSHMLKTRGLNNLIQDAILAGLDGVNSRCIDVDQCDTTFIERVILQQGPNNDGGWNLLQLNPDRPGVGDFKIRDMIAINDFMNAVDPALAYFWGKTLTFEGLLVLIGPWSSALVYNKAGGSIQLPDNIIRFPTRAAARAAGMNIRDYDGTMACVEDAWNPAWDDLPGLKDQTTALKHGIPKLTVVSPLTVAKGASAGIAIDAQGAMYVDRDGDILPPQASFTVGPLTEPLTLTARAYSRDARVEVTKTIGIATSVPGKIDFANLQPYWTEIPDSAISKVMYKYEERPDIWGYTGPAAALSAWSGGAYAEWLRTFFIAASAGHHDYYGNEVYAFSRDTLTWARVKEASALLPGGAEGVTVEGPAARHLYSGEIALPATKEILVGGMTGGQGGPENWVFNPVTNAWEMLADKFVNTMACYDPTRDLVFGIDDWSLTIWNPKTRLREYGTPKGMASWLGYYGDIAFATDTLTIAFTRYNQASIGLLDVKDPTTPAFRMLESPADAQIGQLHGLEYRNVDKCFYAWSGTGRVQRIDHKTGTFTTLDPPPGMPAPSGGPGNGEFGRFEYMDDVDAFLAIPTDPNQNVWLWKAAA